MNQRGKAVTCIPSIKDLLSFLSLKLELGQPPQQTRKAA